MHVLVCICVQQFISIILFGQVGYSMMYTRLAYALGCPGSGCVL